MKSSSVKVILLSGKQGSGKSTLSNAIMARICEEDVIPYFFKFADPIYEMQEAIRNVATNYRIPMDYKEGKLLQLLGTEWGRKEKGPDVWVNAAKEQVREISEGSFPTACIFDDCRFPNELAAFPDALTVRLEAPEDVRRERAEGWREDTAHPSETALDGAAFDMTFDTSKQGVGEIADAIVAELKRRG
jgi:hypothetical protein